MFIKQEDEVLTEPGNVSLQANIDFKITENKDILELEKTILFICTFLEPIFLAEKWLAR